MDIKELAYYLYMDACEEQNKEPEEAESGSDREEQEEE